MSQTKFRNVAAFQLAFFDELRDLRQVLEALEYLPDAMFMIKDRDSRYVYMSRELRQAIHFPEGENIVGKTDYDIFPRIVADRFRQNDLLVLAEGKTLLNEIHASLFFDAPAVWSFSSKWPLRNGAGEVIGLITTNRRYSDLMGKDDDLNKLLPSIEMITKQYDQKLNIENLAEACGFSSSHFMHLFREKLGITAHQFLEQIRLHQAISLLKYSSETVATVAQRCGFYDHSSFVKKFKFLTGTTPLRFRRDYRNNVLVGAPSALPKLPGYKEHGRAET
jgi:AraC-like DNA-binding protein